MGRPFFYGVREKQRTAGRRCRVEIILKKEYLESSGTHESSTPNTSTTDYSSRILFIRLCSLGLRDFLVPSNRALVWAYGLRGIHCSGELFPGNGGWLSRGCSLVLPLTPAPRLWLCRNRCRNLGVARTDHLKRGRKPIHRSDEQLQSVNPINHSCDLRPHDYLPGHLCVRPYFTDDGGMAFSSPRD